MKNKAIGFILLILVVIVILILGVGKLLYGGYNDHGISKYPCITIDDSKEETYVCDASGYQVYTANLKEVYFVERDANQISLEEALTSEQITIEEMISVCKKKGDNIYYGENYQILLDGKKCIIAPLDYVI